MKGAFKLKEESYRVLPEKSLAVAVAGMGRFSEVVQKKRVEICLTAIMAVEL